MTPHKLLGLDHIGEINETEKKKKYDVSKYDLIVFEEIWFNDGFILEKLYMFMLDHPEKMFLANGDACQLDVLEILT